MKSTRKIDRFVTSQKMERSRVFFWGGLRPKKTKNKIFYLGVLLVFGGGLPPKKTPYISFF
jgi:hypothetical protein